MNLLRGHFDSEPVLGSGGKMSGSTLPAHGTHPYLPNGSGGASSSHQRNPFIGRSQCVVCGDRARGCNFGAITCASCKEFFRRNAFKHNKLKCYFQSKCEINIYSRRFCAACRLSKCYMMGMKSEYIMSEAEKHERQLKIIERKLNTKGRPDHIEFEGQHSNFYDFEHSNDKFVPGEHAKYDLHSPTSGHPNGTSLFPDKEIFWDTSVDALQHNSHDFVVPSQIKVESMSHQLGLELVGPRPIPSWSVPTFEPDQVYYDRGYPREHNSGHLSPNRYSRDLEVEVEAETVKKLLRKVKIIRESNYYVNKFHMLLRTKDMNIDQALTHHGRCKLRYLTSIVQIMQAETIHELPTNQKCIDLIRIAEIVTFNFIKMCKKLYAFQALSPEDQVALVKGGVMDTLMIWSMMIFNLENECWEALDLERNFRFSLKLEMLKEANPKLYEKHRSYAMSFEPEWRYNDNLMSLLIAIALFNEDRPNISNVQMIRDERTAYCNLLRQYLSALYEESMVDEMYNRLLNQLQLTETISDYHVKAYFDVSANEVAKNGIGGLIMEIFDLNN